ncbi:hypothetical protein VCNHCC008D_003362B, partial [Vibrio cholerae O1 str. NHCC-008D]
HRCDLVFFVADS